MTPKWFWNLITIDMRFEFGDFIRAGGGVECRVCRREYYDHPMYNEWLHITCEGELVKL